MPRAKRKAPAAPEPEDDDEELAVPAAAQLGKRKIKATTVMIDGHAVKRQNMYGMEEGEGSVWDRELSGKTDDAFEYKDRPEAPKVDTKPTVPKPKAAPRSMSEEERERQKRNDVIRRAREAAVLTRRKFMEPQRALLTRFGAKLHPQLIGGAAFSASPDARANGSGFLEDPTIQQPAEIAITMRDYQLRGLRWLVGMHKCGVNAILADEMGLGKTLQTIAFLAYLKFELKVDGPHLVICPLSVLSSWMTEIKRFCPSLRAIKLHSSDPEERKRLVSALGTNRLDVDIVVTTYEMAKSPNVHTQLAARSWWRYLVVDEGHVLKNDESQISQAVRRFHFAHALLLTGTPLQNNLHELWALLNFLYPETFPSSDAFDSAFEMKSSGTSVCDNEQLAAASRLMRPFMLRRTMKEVETLPPKLETTISCPLSEMQLFWYKRLLLRESVLLRDLEKSYEGSASVAGADWKRLSSLLMQLRKCCNHPFLFPDAEPSSDEAYAEQLISGSGKFALLDRLLSKLYAAGHRVVLFSQFTSTLDLLEELLNYRDYRYCRLDGSTNRVQRTVDINAFNMPGSSRFVFLMSTRAGGLGINCQTADTCILFDSDWNPQVDLQAMARVHRIGQKKVVHLYRLVSSGTVEERIVQRAQKKLYLDRMVNQESASSAMESAGRAAADEELDASEMMSMLRFGAACCFSATADKPPTDAEIVAIIDRTRTESDTVGSLVGGQQHSVADFDARTQELSLRALQGCSYGESGSQSKPGSAAGASDIESLAGMLGGGTIADINDAWEKVSNGKRKGKSRMSTVKVAGVGEVNVLRDNDYCMGEDMANSTMGNCVARDAVSGRQLAGRDFAHESRCLKCWQGPKAKTAAKGKAKAKAATAAAVKEKAAAASSPAKESGKTGLGGGLRGCDLCPASYHLSCVKMREEDAGSFGVWACPHHQCAICGRKANHVGGLLFRCSVCPDAFCEDHLPPEALIMGENPRYRGLGFRHPKQGCYVLHGTECVALAVSLGFDCGEASQSASAILGATGVDTTGMLAKKKIKPIVEEDKRSNMQRLTDSTPGVAQAIRALLKRGDNNAIARSSPAFMHRATLRTSVNRPGTNTSALDLMHDLLYATDLYNSNNKDDDAYRKSIAEKISQWTGAPPIATAAATGAAGVGTGATAAAPATAPKSEDEKRMQMDKVENDAAELYLRLIRELEGTKAPTLIQLAVLLGVQRVKNPKQKDVDVPQLTDVVTSIGRKALAPIIALFLSVPSEQALYLDERDGRQTMTVHSQAGDPGFLINGPPFPGTLIIVQGRIITPRPPPRPMPQYRPFPQYSPFLQRPPPNPTVPDPLAHELLAAGIGGGTTVRIINLVNAAQYNGQLALVVGWLSGMQRVQLRFMSAQAQKPVALKLANIERVTQAPSVAPSGVFAPSSAMPGGGVPTGGRVLPRAPSAPQAPVHMPAASFSTM